MNMKLSTLLQLEPRIQQGVHFVECPLLFLLKVLSHLRHLFVPRHQADADDAPLLRRLHLSRVLLRQQHVRHVRQVRAVEAPDSDVSDVRRRLASARIRRRPR